MSGEVVQNSTTTFADGGEVVMAEKTNTTPSLTRMQDWVDGTVHMQIKDFFAKPVVLQQYTAFTGVGLVNSPVIPQAAFAAANSPYPSKAAGFLGFKATTVLTLVFNATKFTQGRLLLGWIPNRQNRNPISYWTRSNASVVQLPHVELDVSCDSKAILRIPYCNIFPYIYIQGINSGASSEQSMGTSFLWIYSAISVGASAGSVLSDATLYCHFEDVELVTPTNAGLAQSGSKRRFSVKTEDKEKGVSISQSLLIGASAAETLSNIPFISSFAQPASWVLSAVGNLAARFGFSKPVVDSAPMRIGRQETVYMNNKEGNELCIPMGFSAVNSVGISPQKLGSDIDEMALSFVSQIPCYFDTVGFATSSSAGSLLYSCVFGGSTGKGIMPGVTFDTTLHTVDLTPLNMLWEMFHYFHGSIIITLKIVKTSFHSGRLMVVFNPGGPITSLTYSNPYVLKQVFDLQDGNVFEFELPHANLSYWLRLSSRSPDTFGSMSIFVLNPLIAPDTCSSAVEILMEMRGGMDCRFAVPKESGMAACVSNATQFTGGINGAFKQTVAQSSTADPCMVVPEKGSFGGLVTLPTNSMSYEELVIGEDVASLKQLCSIANRFDATALTSEFGFMTRNFDAVFSSANSFPAICYTNLSYVASCYGYASGGYKYYVQSTAALNCSYTANCVVSEHLGSPPVTPGITKLTTSSGYANGNIQYTGSFVSTNVASFSVPSYNQLPMRIINASYASYDIGQSPYVLKFCLGLASTTDLYVWRALGDDGRFSFWLGTPPTTFT